MRRSEEQLHGELDEVDVFGRTGFLDEASGEEVRVDSRRADVRVDLPGGVEGELVADVVGVAPRARTQELTARVVDPVLGFEPLPLNVRGFYDGLIAFLDEVVERGFLKNAHRSMLIVAQEPMELIERLRAYEPPAVPKWITVGKR
jgi:hypothetical protein